MTYVGSSWVELDYWGDSTGYGYEARWRVLAYSTQNVTANTSRIYFKLQKRVTGGSAYNYNSLSFRITGTGAGGDGHSATQTWSFGSVSSTSWADVGGDTSDMYWADVRHNADGTLTISATATGDRVLSSSDFDTNITIQLPTIPRATVPAVSPAPLTLSGATNPLTVTLNRASSSFAHKVTCTIGSYTEQKNAATSCVFDVPDTILADFTATSQTLTGSIECKTYSNSNYTTLIGTKTISFQAKIDTTQEHPVVSSITLSDTNADTSAVESPGSYIKGASDLQAVIAATVAGNYTLLKKITVTCGAVSQEFNVNGQSSASVTFTYSEVNAEGLTVTIEDQRGTKVTETRTWTLINYRPLTVTGSIKRTTNTGSSVNFTLAGDCFGGSFGNSTNVITITYKYQEVGAGSWTTGSDTFTYTPSPGDSDFTYSNTISGFLYNKQYDIVFTVTDLFSTADTSALRLLQGVPIQAWGPDYTDVYGELHLHDPDDPTDYWALTPANDLASAVSALQGQLTMTNVSASGSYTNSSASKAYSVTGAGLVIFNVYAVSASNQDDTGQVEAYVQLLNSSGTLQATLARDGNRLSSSSTFRNAANASGAYYFDGGTNNRLNFYTSNTKSGSTSWRIQIVAIGCTVTAL